MSQLVNYKEAELQQFKDYTLQLRQETGQRLANLLFDEQSPKPVFKLWTMYQKKAFMSLTYPSK